jgi:phage tail-like protein
MAISFVTPVVDPLGPEGALASALSRDIEPFEATVIGYDTILLSWKMPIPEAWDGLTVVRSRSGFPRSFDDGVTVVLYEADDWFSRQSKVEIAPLAGGWHYFSIFLKDAFGWVKVSQTDALVPFDYSSTDKMWDTIPEHYREIRDDAADLSLVNLRINADLYDGVSGGSAPNLLLSAFISVFGWGFDLLRTEVEYLTKGYDPNVIHPSRLRLLAKQFGHEIETAVSAQTNRTIVRNLASLYRNRGTLDGISDLVSAVSGWDVDVRVGPNKMLSQDQSAFTHPNLPTWDPTVKYALGQEVKHGNYVFKALQVARGNAQMPPATETANAYWSAWPVPRYNKNILDAAGGPYGWTYRANNAGENVIVPNRLAVAYGAPTPPSNANPKHTNALQVYRLDAVGATWVDVLSTPAGTGVTSWDRPWILKTGIPIPRPTAWREGIEYRLGDYVTHMGAAYEAVRDTDEPPITINPFQFSHGAEDGTAFGITPASPVFIDNVTVYAGTSSVRVAYPGAPSDTWLDPLLAGSVKPSTTYTLSVMAYVHPDVDGVAGTHVHANAATNGPIWVRDPAATILFPTTPPGGWYAPANQGRWIKHTVTITTDSTTTDLDIRLYGGTGGGILYDNFQLEERPFATEFGSAPTVVNSEDWQQISPDTRVPLVLSYYAHGKFTGTAGTGGLNVPPSVRRKRVCWCPHQQVGLGQRGIVRPPRERGLPRQQLVHVHRADLAGGHWWCVADDQES